MSESVLLIFSSKSFIVPGVTFRFLILFEFIFVYGVRKCSSFILLQVVEQFSQIHLLKRLSFLHHILLLLKRVFLKTFSVRIFYAYKVSNKQTNKKSKYSTDQDVKY